ncbi:flagellar hook-length control protein FliK [Halopseudomonas oceani]|nr:flagellar hook-length control protein FliK [Halopseudomonas oceani]GGE30686.1 flagellar hook-length control protein FliK [Halopseudomonas oceani]
MSPDFRLPPTSVTQPTGTTTAAPVRPADAIMMALQLLRPIDAQQLLGGDQANAEVVQSSNKPNISGQFDLLLKIVKQDMSGGTTLPASTSQPVAPGTQMVVQAVTQTQLIAVVQQVASQNTQLLTQLDPEQFPAGTPLQARVISQQAIPASVNQAARYELVAQLVQQSPQQTLLSITSARPVEPGTQLNATVGSQGELRVLSSSEQVRQADLLQGLRTAFQQQASSELLLTRLASLAAAPQELPPVPALQLAIANVLKQIVDAPQLMTATGVANAVAQSGSFLEANLARLADIMSKQQSAEGAVSVDGKPTTATGGDSPKPALPALDKLLPLLASLSAPRATEPLAGADFKGALVGLLVTLQQQLPGAVLQPPQNPAGPWQQAMQLAQQGTSVKPGLFPLPARALQALGETSDLGSLLRLTAALLSRIQHHQLQSMGQTQTFSDGSSQTTWQLEIPLRDGQQFNHVQVRIQRDESAPTPRQPEPVPVWEVRLAFNLDHLGSMQAIARLRNDKISSELWAERQETLGLINSEIGALRDRLLAKGLDVGELSCHRGAPPPPRQPVQQGWVDEVT